MILRMLVCCTLLFALMACGVTSPERTPSPTAQPAAGEPLVALRQEGGLKGAQTTLIVWRDGRARLTQSGLNRQAQKIEWNISDQQLAVLEQLIESAEFMALKENYIPQNTCCDRISYTLTVATPQAEKTVRTMDGVDWPPVLEQTINLLFQIQNSAPGQ
ncbi:MAG: hypothetical protein KatS3mg057_2107 [Herpetosiphonaceae bacterium]|nr:MAG: hypothetical protein KatS3mg057_2107 [Herpetosiphonaceae bacterium]